MSYDPEREQDLPADVHLQVDRVCQAFDKAWRSGKRPGISPYLANLRGPTRGLLLRRLLLLDLEYRQRLGERPRRAEYLAEIPGDANVLQSVFGELFPEQKEIGPESENLPPAACEPDHPSSRSVICKGSLDGPDVPHVRLDVIRGPSRGLAFVIAGHENFLVGRSSRADLRMPKADRYFSRVHFMVEMNSPCCRLYDMDSTNGTKINGQRVQSADLHDGDLVEGGDTAIRVALLGVWQLPAVSAPIAFPHAPSADVAPLSATATFVPKEHSAPITPQAAPVRKHKSADRTPSIPGYRLEREIGRGGMGIVYLAVREADGHLVAVKTIRPAMSGSAKQVEQFLREARILQQLRHPNIVLFHASGQAGENFYFVMDYVEGVSAAALVKRDGPLEIGRAVRLVCQALAGLQFAHEAGFVHRDVKPANLLVESRDGKETCKVADFGLARAYHATAMSGLTLMGDVGGTIPFMAPEQITHYREAKPPADQYAAAAALYYLLTREHLFEFAGISSQQRLAKILCEEPVSLATRRADVPPGLARAVDRALSKEVNRRFPDVNAFREALQPFAHE